MWHSLFPTVRLAGCCFRGRAGHGQASACGMAGSLRNGRLASRPGEAGGGLGGDAGRSEHYRKPTPTHSPIFILPLMWS